MNSHTKNKKEMKFQLLEPLIPTFKKSNSYQFLLALLERINHEFFSLIFFTLLIFVNNQMLTLG